jgi:predicted nucleic acid-binding protein
VSLLVVDASVLAAFYTWDDPRRPLAAFRLGKGDALFAPAHVDVEVTSALRGLARRSPTLRTAVPAALKHLAGLPMRRSPIAPLLDRMWELRENVSPYDAAYVALAEHIGGRLLTCDSKLAAASGPRCDFEVVT